MQLYQPPAPGEADHADQNFRAKRHPCGRCGEEFTTTPRWRFFCPKCRVSPVVKKTALHTFSMATTFGKRRPGGAE